MSLDVSITTTAGPSISLTPEDGPSISLTTTATTDITLASTGLRGPGLGWFDVTDYGATSSPDDIGPAVGEAFDAAIDYGGGVVFIPPRADGVSRLWGWTTYYYADGDDMMNLALCGVPGQTFIGVGISQSPLLDIGHSNAFVQIDGITCVGSASAGSTNATYLIFLRQARTGIVTRCNFYGISCSSTGYGLVRIVADNTRVEDCIFSGCGYTGTVGLGGVLSIRGARDACNVKNLRFQPTDGSGFNGNVVDRSNASTGAHLWIGAQAESEASVAYGDLTIENCHFDANAANQILVMETGAYIDRISLRGNKHNAASNNDYPVAVRARQLVAQSCSFGNSAAGQIGIGFAGEKLSVQNCYGAAGGKTIKTLGATTYAEMIECPGMSFDFALATPTHYLTQTNGTRTLV